MEENFLEVSIDRKFYVLQTYLYEFEFLQKVHGLLHFSIKILFFKNVNYKMFKIVCI